MKPFSAVLLALAASPSLLLAQTDRATLTGTITDTSGLPIPDATVTATATGTDQTRVVKTTSAGVYTVPALPVGRYTVSIVVAGFEKTAFAPFDLQVGQTRTLDAQLQVANTQTEIVVTAPPALAESTAVVGGVIAPEQIRNLPVNGRNWTNLMALTPGAVDTGSGDQKSIRFAGRAQDDNNYRFDGVDATGVQNQGQRTSARLQISTDAIAEFRASAAVYGADQGGSPGGQVEVVTRSGTNKFHGSVFEFIRNDIFDARRFNDTAPRKPPFRMNQFGGNIGGPILRDRTFFFVDFEAIRQVLGQSLLGLVPSPAYRAAVLAKNPALKPILDAYPQGQAQYTTDADIFAYRSSGKQLLNETSGLFRVDHRFTDRTSAFVRFNTDHLEGDAPLAGQSGFYLQDRLSTLLDPYNAIISVQHIFTPSILNDSKIGFNRSAFITANESILPYAITDPSFTTLNNSLKKIAISNTYSVLDNASFVFGKHALKAGIEIRAVQINQSATASNDLTVAFNNKTDFSNNVVSSVVLNSVVPLTSLRKVEDFGYVTDEYKATSKFTINAGLRYEFFSNFHEAQNRGVVFDPNTCGVTVGFCPAGTSFYNPYYLNLEPRVAFSVSPFNSGKTVLNAGYGIYAGDGQLGDLNAPVNNIATRETLNSKGLNFPVDNALAAGLNTSQTPRGLFRNRIDQQVMAWSGDVQQQLPGRNVLLVQYVGTKAAHLFTRTYVNLLNPVTKVAPIPTLGLIDYKETSSDSNFHALELSLKHDFTSGLFFQANYQYAHSINDGSTGGGEALSAENVSCRICDRASSDQDIRHYFTANTVYQLPFGRGKHFFGSATGLQQALVGGWQLSAIGTARTGLPLNILVTRKASDLPDGNNANQRPDRVPGVSIYPAVKTKANWLNPAAFITPASQTWGNTPRNVARAPGLWQVDPALAKRVAITERAAVEFRAEAFNVFNRQQIGLPAVNISSPTTFGVIPVTVNELPTGSGTPREMQFMLRVEF